MACDPATLRQVPLFALLDDDEMAVLASQVELKTFAPRQRIYKAGDAGGRGYIVVSGTVRVTTVDEDQQEVVVDRAGGGRVLRLRFHAGPDAAPDQRRGRRRGRLHRSGPPRHHGAAGAQAACRHGHARRARQAVPRLAATGARALHAQSQRSDRRADHVRQPHRRRGGALRRIVDLHHLVRLRAGGLHRDQRVARQAVRGIPTRSSC